MQFFSKKKLPRKLVPVLRKKWVMNLIFCTQISLKAWKLQIDTMILMGMVKHSQSFQNSKLAMSLHYLKKELRDEVDFLHWDKHQSFNKLALSFLMEVAKLVQSTQNRISVIFLKYTKKKKWQILLCSIVMQNIQIFYGVQSCSLLLVFHKVREIFQV